MEELIFFSSPPSVTATTFSDIYEEVVAEGTLATLSDSPIVQNNQILPLDTNCSNGLTLESIFGAQNVIYPHTNAMAAIRQTSSDFAQSTTLEQTCTNSKRKMGELEGDTSLGALKSITVKKNRQYQLLETPTSSKEK